MALRHLPVWILLVLVGCLPGSRPAREQAPDAEAPLAGRRVLFLGDSITQDGRYVTFVEYYLNRLYPAERFDIVSIGLASETVSGLSEAAHPFPRPWLRRRLQAALDAFRPDVVFALYGMNDGIYHPQHPDRMQAFQDGVRDLIARVRAAGATLILLTPPPFDPAPLAARVRPAGASDYSYETPYAAYDAVLADYARWERSLPRADAQVIDLHTPLSEYLASRRAADPDFRLNRDGIHPDAFGHLLMARVILRALGVPLPEPPPEQELARVSADPLFELVAERRRRRSEGWLPYVGYTRGDVFKSEAIAETERAADSLQLRIDRLRAPR